MPDGILASMQRIDGHLVLSPTDLTKHVACAHITSLDLEALDSAGAATTRASGADDSLNLVFAKGLEHERAYLERLRADGRVVEDIAALGVRGADAEAATVDAMRRGVDVIYQATFFDGHWVGLADFLLRVDLPEGKGTDLGPWRYDIADTKLARRLKVPALLQMADVCRPARDAPGRATAVAHRRHGRHRVAPVAPRRRRALRPAAPRRAPRRRLQPARDRVRARPALRAVPVEGALRPGVARP